MNLLFVIGSLHGGGAEGVMSTLANELSSRGHKVTLITSLSNQKYEIRDTVDLIDCRTWEYDTFKGSMPTRIYKKAANRFKDYHNLKRIIRETKPDLVMSFLICWLWQLVLICKGRIPLVFADRNATEFKLGRGDFFTRHVLFKMADVVQVMSYHDKAYLRNRYKNVVPMANPLRFSPLTKEEYDNIFPKRKNILAVGRLDPQKGFDKLIRAFAQIADKHLEWNVDICGEDMHGRDYSLVLKKIVSDNNLEDRIHFIGYHKDVDKVMREHAIFSLSSQHEGFPNVLSEAMANGMACISFDIVTGPHEIILDGLDGMIVEDQNVEALAEGLTTLIDNCELRYSYGLHAIQNISRFNCDTIVNKWERLFSNTIKKYHEERKCNS